MSAPVARFVFSLACSISLAAFGAAPALASETVASAGCPLFHCTAEATGVMYQPVVTPTLMTKNSTLGNMKAQGCSGDGTLLACLFTTDNATGVGQGTLKVLNGTTLQPIWGSAGIVGSYNLNASTAAGGQVPVNFSDGRIAAGDATVHVLYDAAGTALGVLPVGGKGSNLGLTPISDTLGIVSQSDGVLTLVDLTAWQSLGTLTLRDPGTGARVTLVSPSSASDGVLYSVGQNAKNNHGFLFAVVPNASANGLVARSTFTFVGKTGASPVVVTPVQSGLSGNLILLHTPGLLADPVPQNRLLGVVDDGSSLATQWTIALTDALSVAPTIDEVTQTLFFQYRGPEIFQYGYVSGDAVNVFDIGALGNFGPNFTLNGHVVSVQTGINFKLLLSGTAPPTPTSRQPAQYVIAFAPTTDPTSLLWTRKIDAKAYSYTAAWTLGPSGKAGVKCPIVVGVSTQKAGILTRLCNV